MRRGGAGDWLLLLLGLLLLILALSGGLAGHLQDLLKWLGVGLAGSRTPKDKASSGGGNAGTAVTAANAPALFPTVGPAIAPAREPAAPKRRSVPPVSVPGLTPAPGLTLPELSPGLQLPGLPELVPVG